VAAAVADVDAAIADAVRAVPVGQARSIIGVAGTVTTVTALALDLPTYDAAKIHQARIPASRIHEVAAQLLASTREQRAGMGPVHPGRVDTIPAGALVLDRVVTALGEADLIASEHDILDGIARSLL
jgi:exopolyphosphatase/guanosine-5'-triphosphate,3'-diphosphate pyrophosphatase